MYQVVASDLDGTLLSPDHTLSPYAKETLKLLTARGINFVFATGRHHVDVGQIRDNLEIKSYMITSNGARVHDLDGNLIFAHNLDRDIASDLFGVVNDNPDIITNVYRDDEWFMNRHRPEEMRFFKEAVFNYALYEPGLLEPEGVSKVFFTCDSHEKLLPLEQAINARWGDRVNVSFSTLTCTEVMAGGVSKGHARSGSEETGLQPARLYCLWRWNERCRNAVDGGERLHYGQRASTAERSASRAGSDWY